MFLFGPCPLEESFAPWGAAEAPSPPRSGATTSLFGPCALETGFAAWAAAKAPMRPTLPIPVLRAIPGMVGPGPEVEAEPPVASVPAPPLANACGSSACGSSGYGSSGGGSSGGGFSGGGSSGGGSSGGGGGGPGCAPRGGGGDGGSDDGGSDDDGSDDDGSDGAPGGGGPGGRPEGGAALLGYASRGSVASRLDAERNLADVRARAEALGFALRLVPRVRGQMVVPGTGGKEVVPGGQGHRICGLLRCPAGHETELYWDLRISPHLGPCRPCEGLTDTAGDLAIARAGYRLEEKLAEPGRKPICVLRCGRGHVSRQAWKGFDPSRFNACADCKQEAFWRHLQSAGFVRADAALPARPLGARRASLHLETTARLRGFTFRAWVRSGQGYRVSLDCPGKHPIVRHWKGADSAVRCFRPCPACEASAAEYIAEAAARGLRLAEVQNISTQRPAIFVFECRLGVQHAVDWGVAPAPPACDCDSPAPRPLCEGAGAPGSSMESLGSSIGRLAAAVGLHASPCDGVPEEATRVVIRGGAALLRATRALRGGL